MQAHYTHTILCTFYCVCVSTFLHSTYTLIMPVPLTAKNEDNILLGINVVENKDNGLFLFHVSSHFQILKFLNELLTKYKPFLAKRG